VNAIQAQVNRPLGAGEKVNANSALGRKVPYTSPAIKVGKSCPVDGLRAEKIRWKLVRGV